MAGAFKRAALIALILACFVSLQTASAAADHPHEHGRAHTHCCPVCHLGHLPGLQAAAGFQLPPPTFTEWRNPHEKAEVSNEFLTAFSPSRAPPA